ncbi:hypothetical protein ACFWPA_15350 [Rhodococcus sp. NPDC058505]|uniref:hypothetical protein n=1 Tax=Rhodococcus sp. NPDC058505 TaxID=3346531 RepID=UPI0036557F92
MARVRTTIRAAGLVIAATALAACGSRDYPGADLDALPADAVGAVSVATIGLEQTDLLNQNRSLTFLFDAAGNVVGRVEGNDISYTQALASPGRLVTVSADAVTTLTPTTRTEVGIDEFMVQAAVNDPATGTATIWFNSGRESSFVTLAGDGHPVSGSVPGLVVVAAQCGDRAVAIARDVTPADAEGRWLARLVEVPAGGTPVERGRWFDDPDFSAVSSTGVCTPDGTAMLSLHRSPPTPGSTEAGLALARTELADGARSAEPIKLAGRSSAAPRSLTVVDDRLHWLTREGEVLSVPLDGPAEARLEWTIPATGEDIVVSVSGTVVAALHPRQDPPALARYDLVTGEAVSDPVPLPWLTDIVGSATESGNNTYTVSDLDLLPPSDD